MGMQNILFREALNQAMFEEMERDPNVFLLGEEVGRYNGAYKVSLGMLDHFGPKRVVDTPISENGFTGLAIGAAMTGLRPIVEYMSFNFSLVALDQIVSNAAKTLYMSGGQFSVPLVMRGPGGPASQVAAQHSNVMDSIFAYFPGLKVIAPTTAYDAKGLLKSAIRDDNPVVFIENEMLYGLKEDIPEEEYTVPIGVGDIKVAGDDVTIVAYGRMGLMVKEMLPEFVKEGIGIELVDPRTIKPLDIDLISQSVRKTHRAVIVEEGHRFCGVGAEIGDQIYSRCFDDLDAPIARVTHSENPLPYAKGIEAASLPSEQSIMQAVKQVLYRL